MYSTSRIAVFNPECTSESASFFCLFVLFLNSEYGGWSRSISGFMGPWGDSYMQPEAGTTALEVSKLWPQLAGCCELWLLSMAALSMD